MSHNQKVATIQKPEEKTMEVGSQDHKRKQK